MLRAVLLFLAWPARLFHRSTLVLFATGFLAGALWILVENSGYRVRVTLTPAAPPSPEHIGGNGRREDEEEETGGVDRMQMILVGVMTAQRYLDNRALEVWRTWAREIPGEVVFFVGQGTEVSAELRAAGMPIYELRGVDDSIYPPQKKSFAMLHWMHENFLGDFGWFMRTDDDIYVRPWKLKRFLETLDWKHPWYIGQAGLGNEEEFGKLSLGPGENYCMGGPGVVLSQETLRRMGPYLRECLQSVRTNHEDVELGRCVYRHAGIPCTWNYEMQKLFLNSPHLSPPSVRGSSHSAGVEDISVHSHSGPRTSKGKRAPPFDIEEFFRGNAFRAAITLHPVKLLATMRRIHVESERLHLEEFQEEWARLRETSERIERRKNQLMDQRKYNKKDHNPRPLGMYPKENALIPSKVSTGELTKDGSSSRAPAKAKDDVWLRVPYWEYFSLGAKTVYCEGRNNCPRHATDQQTRIAINQIAQRLLEGFNVDAREKGRQFQFQSVNYVYRRVDLEEPRVDYVLDLAMLYRRFSTATRKPLSLPVRRHVYVRQRFGPLRVLSEQEYWSGKILDKVEEEYEEMHRKSGHQKGFMARTWGTSQLQRESITIHMIVPLKGRLETLYRFIENLRMLLRENESGGNNDLNLHIVVVLYPSGNLLEDQQIHALIQELSSLLPVDIVRVPEGEEFGRAKALTAGARSLPPDSLLFFVDVDILFDCGALERIRANTILGAQVFFPIVFSEFNPVTWRRRTPYSNSSSLFEVEADSSTYPAERFSAHRGYFRTFGYGIVALYRRDLDAVGGFDLGIHGWGLEDVNLFDRFLNASARTGIGVFRAIEPGLVHVYHPVDCRSLQRRLQNLVRLQQQIPSHSGNGTTEVVRLRQQLEMCLGTRAQNFASRQTLAEAILLAASSNNSSG